MVAILVFLLRAVAVVLAVLILLLALPIHYSAQVSFIQQKFSWDWQLRWGWLFQVDRWIKSKNASLEQDAAMEKPSSTDDPKRTTAQPAKKKPRQKAHPMSGAEPSEPATMSPEPTGEPEIPREAKPSTRREPSKPLQDEPSSVEQAFPVSPRDEAEAPKPEASTPNPSKPSGSSGEAEVAPQDDDAIIAENSEMGSTWQERLAAGYETARDFWSYRHWALAWGKRFLHEFHLTPLTIRGTIGLGDPYLTAQVFGFITIGQSFSQALDISVQPSFLEVAADVDARISGWVSPLFVLVQAVLLLLDPKARALYRKIRAFM